MRIIGKYTCLEQWLQHNKCSIMLTAITTTIGTIAITISYFLNTIRSVPYLIFFNNAVNNITLVNSLPVLQIRCLREFPAKYLVPSLISNYFQKLFVIFCLWITWLLTWPFTSWQKSWPDKLVTFHILPPVLPQKIPQAHDTLNWTLDFLASLGRSLLTQVKQQNNWSCYQNAEFLWGLYPFLLRLWAKQHKFVGTYSLTLTLRLAAREPVWGYA